VTEGLEEGVLFKSASGTISGWNPSAERILGSARERLGTDAVKGDGAPFVPEDQPDALALRTGLPSPRMIMGISRDGGKRTWISVRAHPLTRSGEDTPHGVAMSVHGGERPAPPWDAPRPPHDLLSVQTDPRRQGHLVAGRRLRPRSFRGQVQPRPLRGVRDARAAAIPSAGVARLLCLIHPTEE
jgi:PAS domain-containing protein